MIDSGTMTAMAASRALWMSSMHRAPLRWLRCSHQHLRGIQSATAPDLDPRARPVSRSQRLRLEQQRREQRRPDNVDEESIVLEDISDGAMPIIQPPPPRSHTQLLVSPPEAADFRGPNHLSNFALSAETVRALHSRFKITDLTPIQAAVLEPALAGHDVIARSRTGSGKTLAFLIPIIERLSAMRAQPDYQRPGPSEVSVVILEPTRELVMQVERELNKLTDAFLVGSVYGGSPYPRQEAMLARGLEILIATPGRLLDHMARKNVTMANTAIVVLDEADEMLRLGFVEDVETIIKYCPTNARQMMLFSATLPRWVESVIKKHCTNNPQWIDQVDSAVGSGGDSDSGAINQTSQTIDHYAMTAPTDANEKASLIATIIQSHYSQSQSANQRIIVFVPQRTEADFLASHPSLLSLQCRALHGDQSQTRRDAIMDGFRKGSFRVLIATDIAARGLDIPSVSLIIHAYFPEDAEAYVHRSGRTGRMGAKGKSLILYQPRERAMVAPLSERIGSAITNINPPSPIHNHNDASISTSVKALIDRHAHSLSDYDGISQQLYEQHGLSGLSALIAAVFHPTFNPRSILSSLSSHTALSLKNDSGGGKPMMKDAIITRLQFVTGRTDVGVGRVEHYSGGAVVDVRNDIARELKSRLEKSDTVVAGADAHADVSDISFPSELPSELFSDRGSSAVRALKARWNAGVTRYGHSLKDGNNEEKTKPQLGQGLRGLRGRTSGKDRSEQRVRNRGGARH